MKFFPKKKNACRSQENFKSAVLRFTVSELPRIVTTPNKDKCGIILKLLPIFMPLHIIHIVKVF